MGEVERRKGGLERVAGERLRVTRRFQDSRETEANWYTGWIGERYWMNAGRRKAGGVTGDNWRPGYAAVVITKV